MVLCLNLSGTYRRIIAFCLASLFLSPVITILQFNDNTIMATVVLSYIVMYNICSLTVSSSAVILIPEKTHCLEIIYDRLLYM